MKNPFIVGCWQLDDRSFASHSEAEIKKTFDCYVANGFKKFDTADIYGRSEKIVGKFLKNSDCEIYTKAVFFDGIPSKAQVEEKIHSSLRNLNRESLDLVQVHWHDPILDFSETLSCLKDLQRSGKIKKLGLTNFNEDMIKKTVHEVDVCSHQIQYSLVDRRVEKSMQKFCLENKIALIPYGVLAGGYLSEKFSGVNNADETEKHARSKYYKKMIDHHGGWMNFKSFLESLEKIASDNKVSVAQAAFQWVASRPGVESLLTGFTLDPEKIAQNMQSFENDLSQSALDELTELSNATFEQEGGIYSYERK